MWGHFISLSVNTNFSQQFRALCQNIVKLIFAYKTRIRLKHTMTETTSVKLRIVSLQPQGFTKTLRRKNNANSINLLCMSSRLPTRVRLQTRAI